MRDVLFRVYRRTDGRRKSNSFLGATALRTRLSVLKAAGCDFVGIRKETLFAYYRNFFAKVKGQ
jgi:hypothetical protein